MGNKATPLSAATLLCVVLCALISVALHPVTEVPNPGHRRVIAVISEVSDDQNEVSFVDSDGECWAAVIEDPASFVVGEKYSLVFDNMGTSSVYDDMLIDIS